MQKRQIKQNDVYQSQRLFTASEVAEFECCPLTWWHEQFEPLVHADTDELFAELIAMEHEHGTQAPGLPKYQVIEQLLLHRGAFEEGIQQYQEHTAQVADPEEGRVSMSGVRGTSRILIGVALSLLALALLLVVASFFQGAR